MNKPPSASPGALAEGEGSWLIRFICCAQKGDLVLLKVQHAYQIGKATRINSMGMITAARVGNRLLKYEDRNWLAAWVIGKDEVHAEVLLAVLPTEPFDSYEDAKAFVAPFRKAREVSP